MRRLIIRPGAIGDFIVSLPAIEFLRADYTEVWAARQNTTLVRFADRVRAIPDTGLDLVGIPCQSGAALEIMRTFDEIISWYGASRPEFRDAVAGLPIRFHPALPRDPGLHAADFYLRQAGAPAGAAPYIPCAAIETGHIAIHPFSGSPRKNWPLDRFRDLAIRLEARGPVRWCAGPEEPLEEAVRFDDLYDFACWLAGARLYIGNDSGVTHLAAAAGAPVIALFGPTDPAVWAPRGARVAVASLGASVEEVHLIAESMW
ncbi:MAG: glycosyltransferase family 9 protein [Bryobacteraceae bacterium]